MQSSLSFAELRLFPLLICLDLAVLEDFVHFSIRIDVQVCLPVPEDPLQRSMPGSATFNEPQLVLCRTELRWPLLAAVPLKQRDTPSPRRRSRRSSLRLGQGCKYRTTTECGRSSDCSTVMTDSDESMTGRRSRSTDSASSKKASGAKLNGAEGAKKSTRSVTAG